MQVGTLAAIVTRFNSIASLTVGFPNGIWLDQLPEKNTSGTDIDIEVNGPFVVFLDAGDTKSYCSESAYVEQRGITFMAFGVGAVAAETSGNLVRAWFNDKEMANKELHGVKWLRFELTTDRTQMSPIKTKSGKVVYFQQLDYDVERHGDMNDWK